MRESRWVGPPSLRDARISLSCFFEAPSCDSLSEIPPTSTANFIRFIIVFASRRLSTKFARCDICTNKMTRSIRGEWFGQTKIHRLRRCFEAFTVANSMRSTISSFLVVASLKNGCKCVSMIFNYICHYLF